MGDIYRLAMEGNNIIDGPVIVNGNRISKAKLLTKKKRDGASLGDVRRIIFHQGCSISQCHLCHYNGTKSRYKCKGERKRVYRFPLSE